MTQEIHDILREFHPGNNPYFSALTDCSFQRSDFAETQVQFFNAVIHIHHPMSRLAHRTPPGRKREKILANIQDELGHGDHTQSHEQTFLRFLKHFDRLTENEIRQRPVWPELQAFNAQLDHVCQQQDYQSASATLGMIEHLFADISARIGNHLIRTGWLPVDKLTHYSTHAELDVQHAQDFYDVASPDWPHKKTIIRNGLMQGAQLLDELYRDLYRYRTRRLRSCP